MTGSDELVGQLGRHGADHAGVEESDVGHLRMKVTKHTLNCANIGIKQKKIRYRYCGI
jgi:hypothetical protein